MCAEAVKRRSPDFTLPVHVQMCQELSSPHQWWTLAARGMGNDCAIRGSSDFYDLVLQVCDIWDCPCVARDLDREPITSLAQCFEHAVGSIIVANGPSDRIDPSGNRRVRDSPSVPHSFDEVVARNHLSWIPQEVGQHIEDLRFKSDRLTCLPKHVPTSIDSAVSERDLHGHSMTHGGPSEKGKKFSRNSGCTLQAMAHQRQHDVPIFEGVSRCRPQTLNSLTYAKSRWIARSVVASNPISSSTPFFRYSGDFAAI